MFLKRNMFLFLSTVFFFAVHCEPSSNSYYKTMMGTSYYKTMMRVAVGVAMAYCPYDSKKSLFINGFATALIFGFIAYYIDSESQKNLLAQEKEKIVNNDIIEAFNAHYQGLCSEDKKNVPVILKKYLTKKQL